ncbi:hypothetical protein DFR50_107176 [Roseiarcus fermentans]|uniref:Uncharacterized protein n=1 Tax=Roseiarcus fermentans TaxID=1473586 RepID=A0A366FP48_9HYPH|nr:hypothetical protein [Roseiarcus fermentans]RBP15906.1 hypothetical protein DFR50_107176 [Roseiarcus fermentans]
MTDPDAASPVSPHRARRMFAALIGGAGPEEIGAEENLGADAVARALSAELARRWTPTVGEYAKIQIARLETFCLRLMDRVEAGELAAVDRALKILDRLDRYHGFHRASPALEPYLETHRERLLAKLNAAAANLADADLDAPGDA